MLSQLYSISTNKAKSVHCVRGPKKCSAGHMWVVIACPTLGQGLVNRKSTSVTCASTRNTRLLLSGEVSAPQLEDWVLDPQPLSELPYLGKSVHLNRPGQKHNSGFGLPPIAVTKIYKKTEKCPITWTFKKPQHNISTKNCMKACNHRDFLSVQNILHSVSTNDECASHPGLRFTRTF